MTSTVPTALWPLRSPALWSLAFLATACGGDPTKDDPVVDGDADTDADSDSDTDTDTDTGTFGERYLSDDQLLTRISLDLRGIRPTAAEFDRYAGDPAVLDVMIDEWVMSSLFSRHLEDLFSEIFYTRNGDYYVLFGLYAQEEYGGFGGDTIISHVGEEPLRMLSYLAENELPYTDYVTGNWTMADEFLRDLWHLDYPTDGVDWQVSHYADERPGVGVLSTNSLWWFRGSMENNRNRGRANYMSKVFLCDDYLERPVPFVKSNTLGSEAALGDAINKDPSCTVCHDTLDPLASHFYGWWWYFHDKGLPEQIETYHPEREFLWKDLTGKAPAYFGQPTNGLVDLGEMVSSDPRYPKCFVKHAWELVTRTDADLVEVELGGIDSAFEDSGLRIREVFRKLVHHPAYQGYDERFAMKMASPELLSSQIADLTGYWWIRNGRDAVNSASGFVLLAGGSDGDAVTSSSPTATVTTVMVQQRLAENAATHVVKQDMALVGGGRRLFSDELTFTELPGGDDTVVRAEMVRLERRILGKAVAPDDPLIDDLVALWSQAYAVSSSVEESWVAVVGALLRDPDLVMY